MAGFPAIMALAGATTGFEATMGFAVMTGFAGIDFTASAFLAAVLGMTTLGALALAAGLTGAAEANGLAGASGFFMVALAPFTVFATVADATLDEVGGVAGLLGLEAVGFTVVFAFALAGAAFFCAIVRLTPTHTTR
jgi:hypothetical protein